MHKSLDGISRYSTCKLLLISLNYVGDSLQLPPVNEEISLTFATVKNKVVLTDIVRQEEGNPLLELFSLLRDDIKNQTNTFLNYIVRNRSNIQDRCCSGVSEVDL